MVIRNRCRVFPVVGISFCSEGAGYHIVFHYSVCNDSSVRHSVECDNILCFNLFGFSLVDIDQASHSDGGFHASANDVKHLEAEHAWKYQERAQDDYDNNQHCPCHTQYSSGSSPVLLPFAMLPIPVVSTIPHLCRPHDPSSLSLCGFLYLPVSAISHFFIFTSPRFLTSSHLRNSSYLPVSAVSHFFIFLSLQSLISTCLSGSHPLPHLQPSPL